MSTPAAPRSQSLKFSLRMLFAVVTLFCVWLGFNGKAVNDRRALLQWIEQSNGKYESFDGLDRQERSAYREQIRSLPGSWEVLGSEPIVHIHLPENTSETEYLRVKAMFPEALVGFMNHHVPSY